MNVHPTAYVSAEARIAENVEIGPFTIVHPNVAIGSGSKIGSHCEIGVPTPMAEGAGLILGANSLIRSHSVFYEGSAFGDGLTTGHRVTVRELTKAGNGFQIGTLGDIQGHCTIGDYVRFHSNVHIGQGATIEDCVWIFPYVVLTNDPHPPSEVRFGVTVRKYAAISTMSVVLPGVTIGTSALVGACSCVTKDVEEYRIAAGNPARDKGPVWRIKLRDGSDQPAYPWMSHFRRGYPEYLVREWQDMFDGSRMFLERHEMNDMPAPGARVPDTGAD